MMRHDDAAKEVVKLEDRPADVHSDRPYSDADAEAVAKLGFKATLPRSLSNIVSLIGLNSSIVLPWPAAYFVSALNLSNGGTAGLLLASIVASVFMTAVYLSLAEKLRRFPTAGGQYHFVAALAPPRYRRFLSFFCGFLLCFTWLSYLMSATWLTAFDITAIVLIHTGEYHVKWNFTIAACLCVLTLLVNCCWGKWINYLERLMVPLQLVGFFFLVGLLGSYVNSKGAPNPTLEFTSVNGWSVNTASALGILYTAGALIGFDSASHVSEDTFDAKKQLPRSLLTTAFVGGVSCILIGVMLALCAGNVVQLEQEMLAASGHPIGAIVQLTYNAARGNKALASAPFGLIAPLAMMSCINICAAGSRLLYSLIRDDNNPTVQRLLAKDLRPDQLPRITICFTALSPLLTLWINFVSSVGFPAIVSQVTLSLTTTYLMAICCSLYSRFYQPDLLGRQCKGIFQLGKMWGSINDLLSICFLAYVWIFAWFPYGIPVYGANSPNFNYAPVIVVGVAVLAILYYVLYARKHYRNPAPKDEVDDVVT